MKIKSLLIGIILFFYSFTYAQINQGGTPLSFLPSISNKALINQEYNNVLLIKKPNVDSLIASLPKDDIGPYLFGMAQNVNLDIKSKKPISVENGRLWIWSLKFTDAICLNANFSKFKLGRDAKLFIYTPDKSQILGAFTSINNQGHGKLLTALLPGSEIIIEYFETDKTTNSEIVLGDVAY